MLGKHLMNKLISTGPSGTWMVGHEEQPGAPCTTGLWVHPPPSFPTQVCHHADCQQLHHRGPLNLCEVCDSKFHSAMHYDGHVRFDLPPQGEHREGPVPRAPPWGQRVLVTVGILTRPSEGQESAVNNETQIHCCPFCSTSICFLTFLY